MSLANQFCTFYLNNYFFGVEVEKVQEIIRFQQMTRVPLASPVIKGMINLRGQIVTAIDLRRRMEMEDREEGVNPMNLVIRTDDMPVSLLVDKIGDVIEVEEEIFENCPETLKGGARELIRGTYKLDERLLLILDANKVVEV